MNTNVNTLLFDLDGTLIDTNELIIASFLHTLDYYYPNKYSREDVTPFIGPPLMESFRKIDSNPKRINEMIVRYRQHNLQNHDKLVREYEGVYDTIHTLQSKGYKLAVVTSKINDVVLKGLKFGRLDQFFETIIALDHVKNAKPDPEPIYMALDRLNSSPSESIMVGDNFHDIVAGKNAGTKTAGVTWTMQGIDFLKSFQPDYMLNNMRDLLQILKVE